MRSKKFFNFLRAIGIAAIVCTVAVTVVMLVYSATPGEKSAQQSNQVADEIKEVFDVEEEKVESARVQLSAVKGFVGETYVLSTAFFPEETTDKAVTYKSANEGIAEVSEDGVLTFKKAGTVSVTVSKTNDPSIKHSATMMCYGTHPDKITSISPSSSSYKAGDPQNLILTDQNGEKLLLSMFKPTDYDKNALSFTGMNILPFKEGKTTVTLSVLPNLGKKDYKAKTFDPITLNITHNDNYTQPTDLVLTTETYDLEIGQELYLPSLVQKVLPEGASGKLLSYNYDAASGVVKELVNTAVAGQKVGTVKVKIYTKYNPQLVKYVTVNVFDPPPKELSITGVPNARAQYDKSYTLKVYDPANGNPVKGVTWSIERGTGSIDPKTGKLSDLKLGKTVTVRAAYKDPNDPEAEEVVSTYVVKVVMYEDFAASMRKLVGHFLLFAVIGFGLVYSYVFLLKPRVLAVPLCVVSGFGLAVASEALQLPAVTTGRYATWSDVIIDFFGSAVGMAAAFIVLALILLAFRLSRSRNDFFRAFSAVSAKTLFRSASSKQVQTRLEDKKEGDKEGKDAADKDNNEGKK